MLRDVGGVLVWVEGESHGVSLLYGQQTPASTCRHHTQPALCPLALGTSMPACSSIQPSTLLCHMRSRSSGRRRQCFSANADSACPMNCAAMPLGISTHSLAQRAEAAAQAMNRDMQQAGSLQGAVVAAARLLEAPIGSGRTAEPQTECKVLRIPLTDIKPMAGVTIRERCPPAIPDGPICSPCTSAPRSGQTQCGLSCPIGWPARRDSNPRPAA